MARGSRERLPSQRRSETHEVSLRRPAGDLTVFVGVSRYEDGRPGEVWIDSLREGHELRTAHQAWARMVSIALQYGVPVADLKPPPAPASEAGIWGETPVTSLYDAAIQILRSK